MRCHPLRWLWGLIPVAMLSWAAVQRESPSIEQDLERRSSVLLRLAGYDWASVVFSGREGLLIGYPARARDAEDAVDMVRNVWGVRTVEARIGMPSFVDAPIVPLPERKPAMTLVVASKDAPHAVAASNDATPLVAAGPRPDMLNAQPPSEAMQARDHVAGAALTADTAHARMTAEAPTPPAAAVDGPAAPIEALGTEAYMAPAPAPEGAAASEAPPLPPPEAQHAADLPAPSSSAFKADATLPTPPPEAKDAAAPVAEQPATGEPAPSPAQAPRFETAALPPGNMAPDPACLNDVQAAAAGVEVHFARGDAKLDAGGKAVIDTLVGTLKACPQATLSIFGHTDASGHARRNLALSKRRARTVTRYMVHKGIDAGRLAADGYGESRPVAPNDTGTNRARNRRIEVVITAPAGPLPPMPVRKQGTRNGLSRR
jgi:outer membrane protein OmpA-like peptidoglycan-associated protein